MERYINFNYKYSSTNDNRIHLIEEAGFDGVFIYSQYNPRDYIDSILKSSLKIEALHLPYKYIVNGKCVNSRFVNVLWEGGDKAFEYVLSLVDEIRFAHQYGIQNVVMHITGGSNPPMFKRESLKFFELLLNECDKFRINLCLENLRRLDYLSFIFSNLESSHLKFCFDSGHANAMTQNLNVFPWDQFGHKLQCLHLNDNDGIHDQHYLPFDGNIEWGKLLKTIYFHNKSLPLTLEVRASEEYQRIYSEKEFLKQCIMRLDKFEEILK